VLVHHSEHSWVSPKYEHELPTGSRTQTLLLLLASNGEVLMSEIAGTVSHSQTLLLSSEPKQVEHGAPHVLVHQVAQSWVSPKYEHE